MPQSDVPEIDTSTWRQQEGTYWCIPAVVEPLAKLAGHPEITREVLLERHEKAHPGEAPHPSKPLTGNFSSFQELAEQGAEPFLLYENGKKPKQVLRQRVESLLLEGKPVAISRRVSAGSFHMLIVLACGGGTFRAWDPGDAQVAKFSWDATEFSDDLLTLRHKP